MNDRYRINDAEIIYETIDGEVMLLNLTNGNYFSLDNIGVLIWDLMCMNCPVEVLLEAMTGFDSNSSAPMEASVQKVVSQMQEEGLIIPFEEDTPLNRQDIIKSFESRLRDGSIQFIVPVLHMYKDIQEKYAHPAGIKAV